MPTNTWNQLSSVSKLASSQVLSAIIDHEWTPADDVLWASLSRVGPRGPARALIEIVSDELTAQLSRAGVSPSSLEVILGQMFKVFPDLKNRQALIELRDGHSAPSESAASPALDALIASNLEMAAAVRELIAVIATQHSASQDAPPMVEAASSSGVMDTGK